MNEPKPEQFGYQSEIGFDSESGWMIEGGEDAFNEALTKWNEVVIVFNWKVLFTTQSAKKRKMKTCITTVSGQTMTEALAVANTKAKKQGTVQEVQVLCITGIRAAYYPNRPDTYHLNEEQKTALWQEVLEHRKYC